MWHHERMRENWYSLAHAIISGRKPAEAYAELYGTGERSSSANCSRLMAKAAFRKLLADLREAKQADADAVRSELVAGHLADSRNEALSPADRRAARIALAKMYGLELNKAAVKVETSEDEVFWRQAFTSAPLLKRDSEKA